MAQYLKTLFVTFKKKDIKYCYKTDFNGNGEYHAVLKKIWKMELKKDSTFADGVLTSTFDYAADAKLRAAYEDPNNSFNPFSTGIDEDSYEDRKQFLIFILGRYWLLRGKQEVAYLTWSKIKFCKTIENGVETEYVEIKHDFDKSHEISIQNTVPRHETENSARIYPNPNDPLCPYKFLKFYRTLCPPHQDRVFCMLASPSQCKQHADNGHAYIYNPKRPVGVNKIDNTVLAKRMGFENPDRCTAHGNRKLGITTVVTNAPKDCNKVILEASRHKSIQTSLTYQKVNEDNMESYQKAICRKHVLPPNDNGNAKRRHKATESIASTGTIEHSVTPGIVT